MAAAVTSPHNDTRVLVQPKCSVAIMAHPKRRAFIPRLRKTLDRPAAVIWDRRNDRWDTGRRAQLAFDPEATHHMVIQDDAIVCRDLTAGVEAALKFVPDGSPLGLYVGRVRPFAGVIQRLVEEAQPDASWLKMAELHWGVGVVVPTAVIPDMIAWCDEHPVQNYDRRMSNYFARFKIPVYYPWPSLVEHRDSPTLVHGHGDKRHAHRFAGADSSALDLDWSGRVVDVAQIQTRPRAPGPRATWVHADGRRRVVLTRSPLHKRMLASAGKWTLVE